VIAAAASRRVRELRGAEGFTLTEMIVVLLILGVVIGGLTALFVSGIKSETDQSARAQAQFDARSALDQLRREAHCGSTVNPNGAWPTNAITISLGTWCPSNTSGAALYVTWCTTGSGPYKLRRISNGAVAPSPADYAHACTGAGRLWASDIVNYGTISGGRIFSSPVTPTLPAMAEADLAYASGGATPGLGSSASDVTYGYVVDPIVGGVEQPGTENLITTRAGTFNKRIQVDWAQACASYITTNSVTAFRVYGRTPNAENLLLGTVTNSPATTCNGTTFIDDGTGTTVGTRVGATRTQISVTIPVRADNSTIRLISLPDAMTLRNTPR
jgi:prepilin-type N-terminal cleavage/methylation domain-containing protein